MAFNHTISAILRGRWLLNKQWAESHLPMVLALLNGQPVSFVERSGFEGEMPFVVDPSTMAKIPWNIRTDYGLRRNPNIPQNSVGVIPISGPITKYNGECGEAGAIQFASRIMEMEKSENVSSIILLVDTPGGEARAAHHFVSAIENSKKPILSYVDGMAASLGMWIISATQEVYLSNKMDEVGSVGSYLNLPDFSGMLEMNGIKLHTIYAPQSTDKNKDYKDALQGDYTAIQNDLKLHVDDFIQYVKKSRGGKPSASVKEWNSGKMFYADDAQKLGLIDGVKPFHQVVAKAAWLAKRK